MTLMTIGSALPAPAMTGSYIFCPSLKDLSARLADAAILMPRMDQNRQVKDTPGHGQWAAAVAADPFGSHSAFFEALRAVGYRGVVNWPSSILLEGQTSQELATVPATPAAEYAYLAKAKQSGLQVLAFFLTQEHAAEAYAAGLRDLVLHPGILLDVDAAGGAMIRGALASMVAAVKAIDPEISVHIYTSDWHETLLGVSQVPCDGLVHFDTIGAR